MKTYSNNFNDELRSRLSIVDVIGKRVPLSKRGKDFWGCCPFHNEKTPSFKVSEERGNYYCFGCGEKGDVISFTMKTNNMQYLDALRELAQMAGVKMPEYKSKDEATVAREKSYHDIVSGAAKIYAQKLWTPDGEFALSYIRGRGFTDDDIKKYEIGFAPNGNIIANKFSAEKTENLVATGLVRVGEMGRGNYDFFRNKLMFPIHNDKGVIVAFSGRSLDGSEPKYINTGETGLFKKRATVFGLNFARNDIYKANRSIVVEGQIDAIKMQLSGFGETVAPLGTALSEEHVMILNKLNRNITFCFDGDKAGIKAAARAAGIAMAQLRPESDIRFAFCPAKGDPDTVLSGPGGVPAMRKIIDDAIPLEQFLWKTTNDNFVVSTPAGQTQAEKFFMAEAEKIQDFTLQNSFKKFFKDMKFKEWKFNKVADAAPVPTVNEIENQTLSSIATAHPELIEKHAEFFVKFNIDIGAGSPRPGAEAAPLQASEAEKFIVGLKLKYYLMSLQNEKRELVRTLSDEGIGRISEIDAEIQKVSENIQKISEA
ncbi:MAG: DNA primase [Alphaproteobacteria bacterium]|nr:DNA primase [Alphaproteobacteria bacterium]